MITPTVGRIVWYHPKEGDPGYDGSNVPLAAVVCFVHSAIMVNLAIFDRNGHRYARTSVTLWQGLPGEGPQYGYAEWPPAKVGQAEQMAIVAGGGVMDRVAALERAVLALTESRG